MDAVVSIEEPFRFNPEPGQLWKHWKGETYTIVGVGEHTESGERLVAYIRVGGKHLWLRPLKMFMGKADGGKRYRFHNVSTRRLRPFQVAPRPAFIVDRDPGDETDHDVGY